MFNKADGCIFCAIVDGKAPSKNVWDGDSTIGIVPLNPVVEGHVIFIPRSHVKDAVEDSDVSAKVMADAAEFVRNVRGASAYEGLYDSVNFITSVGEPATQSVFHLHLHVVPRAVDDDLALPWSPGK